MGIASVAHLEEIITAIRDTSDGQALKAAMQSGLEAFGFDGFNMSINAQDRYKLLEPDLTTNHDSFFQDFEKFGFIDSDPVIESCVNVGGVFCWTTHREPRDVHEARLVDFLKSVSFVQGMVVPLPNTPGRLSHINLSSSVAMERDEEAMHCAAIVARVTMMRAESIGLCTCDAHAYLMDADLSVRQMEILSWAAQGKSNGDIAVITGQSKRAVDYHMSEILRKLKVATRAQAIALASGVRPLK